MSPERDQDEEVSKIALAASKAVLKTAGKRSELTYETYCISNSSQTRNLLISQALLSDACQAAQEGGLTVIDGGAVYSC